MCSLLFLFLVVVNAGGDVGVLMSLLIFVDLLLVSLSVFVDVLVYV